MTDLGPLNLLGTIEGGRGYDESYLPATIRIPIGDGTVQVVALSMLAELKRGATSAKDKLTLLNPGRDD